MGPKADETLNPAEDWSAPKVLFRGEANGGMVNAPVATFGEDRMPCFVNGADAADYIKTKWGAINGNGASVYIAGPMRGIPDHNYPTFNAVAQNLRAQGYKVFNPAENFGGDQTKTTEEYMKLDLQMVLDADGIVLLPGWRNSELGRVEAAMAKSLGHQFYEAAPANTHVHDDEGTTEGCPGCFADPANPEDWIVTSIPTPETIAGDGPDIQARSLVYGARNADYGPPVLDFTVVGRKWAATLSAHLQEHVEDIPATIVAVMLTDLKTARQARTPEHSDSMVDSIGYQLCLWRIVTEDGRKDAKPSAS